MRKAVVIDAVRTPVGRAAADKGYFRDVRSEDLSAHVMQAILKRTGIAPAEIEDVRWGCVQQQGEQGFDVARIAALVAGLPEQTGGVTINRNCASSLQAINDAAMSIAAGCEDVQLAGGVEHMEHVPMTQGLQPLPLAFQKAQRGHHEHGTHRRVPGREVPHSRGPARTNSPCAAISSPPRRPTPASSTPRSFPPGDETKPATRSCSRPTSASAASRRSRRSDRFRRRSIPMAAASPRAIAPPSTSAPPRCS